MRKRRLSAPRLSRAAGILACVLAAAQSFAQTYPAKPIRIVCGFPPGTAVDLLARMVAQKLSENLGQQSVVENRTGASGVIAAERVAKSPADGYTLLLTSAVSTTLPSLRAKLPYDTERDFAPVAQLATGTFVLVVHPSVPARNARELVALARSRPGSLSYGSSGVGTVAHLAGELFGLEAKVNIVHVPYKGASEFVVANAAGQVDMSFASVTAVLPLLAAGAAKLRPLAATSAKRTSLMPELPTLDESGLTGYDRTSWYGVTAPAGVSQDIIAQLNAVLVKGFSAPDAKESLNRQGLEPWTGTPEQFATFIRNEIVQNNKLIKAAGIKAE